MMLLYLGLGIPGAALATVVRFETPLGSFDVELFDDVTPLTVTNFLNYVNDGDYENSFIHRKVNDFIVQGGGFTFENNLVGNVPEDPPVINELTLSNVRGTIAMAKLGGDPNSATSEWFISLADNSENLDNQNGGFTVFGRVLNDGMDVVDAIAALPNWNLGGVFTDTPLIDFTNQGPVLAENLVFTGITIVPAVDAEIDATGLTDISGDAVPDVAVLSQLAGKRPRVRYYSGANRNKFEQVAYLSNAWAGVAAATLADANQDGVTNDPAVAVLGRRISNDRLSVQVRMAAGGAELARINFLNNRWTPVDVVVIDDANGDGVSDDTAIGVPGLNPAQGSQKQTTLQVRRLSDGSLLREVYYNNNNWTPLAAGAVQRPGQSPLLAVLAEKNSSKEIRVQARLLSDGSLQRTKTYLNDQWRGLDLAILKDTDGNGVRDDASYMVLAVNPGNGLKRVQVRGTSGALVKNVLVMNDLWQARRILGSDDISGNLVEELGVLGNRISDGKARIELQDFDTGAITGNIFP
ncbi:MAG: peptidylprolyl isomerase [Gammaproteobacteria bacterium]|nr:peptidylprolyl isomerase [Gammaproteobacteria bacterium]